ncbi:MAG: SDR family NAD(P)-dependent oxidoreductase [Acidobacteriota bacterium]
MGAGRIEEGADTWRAPELGGRVALVTGASRGAGRGIATVLGEAGASVYVTARSSRATGTTQGRPETIEETAEWVDAAGGEGIAVRCDHTVDADVEALFERIRRERGRLDILVANAWGGYERSIDHAPFWEQSLEHFDTMLAAGVRSHFATVHGAMSLMLSRGDGLVVLTTAPIKEAYFGNVIYDLAKAATTRMARGMAEDLREHGIAVVALAPGWMRTERVLEHYGVDETSWSEVGDLTRTESRYYVGRAVAELAADPRADRWSGRLVEVGRLAAACGFPDVDGRRVPPFSELFPELYEAAGEVAEGK